MLGIGRDRLLALAFGIALSSVAPRFASADPSGNAAVAWINQLRQEESLPRLHGYSDLIDDAQSHSETMARQGAVFHHPALAGVTTGWARLAQFEARAPTLAEALELALESAEHHEQVYGDYDRIGVGVSESGGYVYVTWFFMKTE